MLKTKPVNEALNELKPMNDYSGVTSIREEPVLALDSIQGNLIGFNKAHQTFLFFKITNPGLFLKWLREFIPFVATAAEVLRFNQLFKEVNRRRGGEARALQSTWVNIAFSFEALKAISSDADMLSRRAQEFPCYRGENLAPGNMKAEAFTDFAFSKGMAARAVSKLNDPSSESADGNPRNWIFGGPGKEADVVIIVASDSSAECEAEVDRIGRSLTDKKRGGAILLWKEEGSAIQSPQGGREHFGFLDGVSQPGMRGRVSSNPDDFLTLRENPSDPNHGKPGQELVWPGEFIFGYPRQARSPIPGHGDDLNTAPGLRVKPEPVWVKDGSFLVIRRLRQDVAAFLKFIEEESSKLGFKDKWEFAAKLFGRWRGGAPIILRPGCDDTSLGADEFKNNKFGFRNSPDDCKLPGDNRGVVCPFAAHIRKANPREDKSGSQNLNITNTQWHRMLRRGIPYGSTSDPHKGDDKGDRGLMFAAYMSSILDQFEFVVQNWINDPNFKDRQVGDTPRPGHDLIIGQARNEDGSRTRHFALPMLQKDGTIETVTVTTDREWVIPTGGGYFFAPSIDALCLLSGGKRHKTR